MKMNKNWLWGICFVGALSFLGFLGLSAQAYAEDSSTEDMELYANMYYSVMNYIADNYVDEVDLDELFRGSMYGLFEALDDPYSVFFTPEELRDITDTETGEFGGVGLIISKPTSSAIEEYDYLLPFVQVSTAIEGTPGYLGGIRAGDYITHVDGVSTVDLTINEAVSLIRGEPGSQVVLTIQSSTNYVYEATIVREIIEIPTIKYAMIDEETAYLKILEFSSNTEVKMREALGFFEENDYRRLVIDLRNNPGGLLRAVVNIGDMFFNDGPIVSTEGRRESDNNVFSADSGVDISEDIPVAVLINRGSASASEILSGALKDRERATLFGETTFGKGLVQEIQGFWDSGFKLTVSRYYTPNGTNINEIGITPDFEVVEEPYSEETVETINELLENHRIVDFIDANRNPSENEIAEFMAELEDLMLSERILRRMIQNEIDKYDNSPPVFDMEYDLVLQEAYQFLLEE